MDLNQFDYVPGPIRIMLLTIIVVFLSVRQIKGKPYYERNYKEKKPGRDQEGRKVDNNGSNTGNT